MKTWGDGCWLARDDDDRAQIDALTGAINDVGNTVADLYEKVKRIEEHLGLNTPSDGGGEGGDDNQPTGDKT